MGLLGLSHTDYSTGDDLRELHVCAAPPRELEEAKAWKVGIVLAAMRAKYLAHDEDSAVNGWGHVSGTVANQEEGSCGWAD